MTTSKTTKKSKAKQTTASSFSQQRFTWPCTNCRHLMQVDQSTFSNLKSGQLAGLSCKGCLPPSDSSALRIAI